jgi:hypothetical protein
VLNKRYHVRRGSQTDLDALMRNVPGGGVMMNDPEKDVKVIDTPDVTQSGYLEQDRISVEFDSLVGSLSTSSVASNRKLGDNVGNAQMLGQNANSVQDYGIRVFLITWMMPVLDQLLRLEQMYENDSVILALAGENNKDVMQKFGIDEITDDLLLQSLTASINVGMGNTDPVRRVERLVYGLEKVAGLPDIAPRLKSLRVADHVFGALGFRNSGEFVRTDEEQAAYVAEHPTEPPPEIAVKMRELDIREDTERARDARETYKVNEEIQLAYAELALKYDTSVDNVLALLKTAEMKDKTARDVAALNAMQKTEEANLKRAQEASKPPEEKKSGPPGAAK